MTRLSKEKKDQIRNHANRNIAYMLDQLKIEYDDRGDGLIQSCCHCLNHTGDGDNPTAWSWRTDLGKWVCWTHHCEEARGNDIFGLVSNVKGTNFNETVKWIIETLEAKDVNLSDEVAAPENLHRGTNLHIHEPLPEDNLKFLKPDPQYLLDRGYDKGVLRDYQVGLWQRIGTYMHDRVVFPIRDHEGYLVGYTGRTIHPESHFEDASRKYAKWVHARHYNRWPKRGDFFTSSILFNLDRAKKYLGQHRRLILVEGPLDGMRLEEAGIKNWAATLSTNLCQAHRTLLVQHGVNDVYNAYDNDDPSKYKDGKSPGDKGWERSLRVVGDLFGMHRVNLPVGQDVGDTSVPVLQEIFELIRC